MRLGWDEIARRAKAFSDEFKEETRERAETQTFYNAFFDIFGMKRRQVAIYEKRLDLLRQKHGFIDLFWPGTLLIELKSGRLDLDRDQGQALDTWRGCIRQSSLASSSRGTTRTGDCSIWKRARS